MGNGSQMPSLEDILAGRGGDSKGGDDTEGLSGVTVDGYRFGSANDQVRRQHTTIGPANESVAVAHSMHMGGLQDLRCRKVRSWEIVKRAKDRLFQVRRTTSFLKVSADGWHSRPCVASPRC